MLVVGGLPEDQGTPTPGVPQWSWHLHNSLIPASLSPVLVSFLHFLKPDSSASPGFPGTWPCGQDHCFLISKKKKKYVQHIICYLSNLHLILKNRESLTQMISLACRCPLATEGWTQPSRMEKAWSSKHTGLSRSPESRTVSCETLGKSLYYF